MIVVLARIEIDAHRNTLHHLHVISGGVLRRQQTEARTAGSADRLHFAGVFLAGCVHAEADALAGVHALQLRLFKIRRHPDVVEWNYGHHLLAGRDILSQFHGLLADDPVDGRDNRAVAEIQLRLIEQSPFLRDLRRGRFRAGFTHRHLLRGGAGGFNRGVRLRDALIGLVDGALRHRDVLFGFADSRLARIERGLRAGCLRYRRIVLLTRNLVLVHQQFVTRHVVVGFLEVRFGFANQGLRRFQAIACRGQLALRS